MRGSPREKALAGFAYVLTEIPWGVNGDDMTHLRRVGLSEPAIEQAILVASFFNYFPRVADGVGIEFDYESPLPRIVVDSTREALPRIPRADWNPHIDGSKLPSIVHAPHVDELLAPWRQMHLERTFPFGPTTRRLLFLTVAEELCDAGAVLHWNDARPTNDAERRLVDFSRKLTRTPWAMNAGDAETLRQVGLSDEAILSAITLVAHQNAISRMHHGLAAMRM